MAVTKSYEEIRQQRIEENKKRLQQLNIAILANSLNKKTSPKPSTQQKPKQKRKMIQKTIDFVPVRRSDRNSNKPAPVYKEVFDYGTDEKPTKRRCSSTRVSMGNYPVATPEERDIATKKAEEIELSLGDEFPSVVRPILHSHVNKGFWLGLDKIFCQTYMPETNTPVTLVDENGGEFEAKYKAKRVGLSGGWVHFAKHHQLIDGDACVFQLTKPKELKVYIIKANGVSYSEESAEVIS